MLGGRHVRLVYALGALVGVGLGRGAGEEAEAVEVVLGAFGGVPAGRQAEVLSGRGVLGSASSLPLWEGGKLEHGTGRWGNVSE